MTIIKNNLHPKNKHKHGYDFSLLCQALPELNEYVFLGKHNQPTIDFADAKAVKILNKALLKLDYQIDFWDIPEHYLCPPIPGRVDYIHYIADLLTADHASDNDKVNLNKIKGLDIGTGASCIYPILGCCSYQWRFVASDIDPVSVQTAQAIVKSNRHLQNKISVKLQKQPTDIFTGIINKTDYFDFTMCNPPFHKSLAEATKGSQRKIKNLTGKQPNQARLNFGGQKAELWCDGGELKFITDMIKQSKMFANQVNWFTSLVSKKDNLPGLISVLKQHKVHEHKVIEMAQGQKVSRFIAWRYNTI